VLLAKNWTTPRQAAVYTTFFLGFCFVDVAKSGDFLASTDLVACDRRAWEPHALLMDMAAIP